MGGLKNDGDGGANVHFAFQLDAGVVDAGNVLDNSQPQTGAAGGLAPALIHPVEAFEHAGLRVFGIPMPLSLTVRVQWPSRVQEVMSWTLPPGRL